LPIEELSKQNGIPPKSRSCGDMPKEDCKMDGIWREMERAI